MPLSLPMDLTAEADDACVQAVPGAVFVRLRRHAAEDTIRRMFVELTPRQARRLARELQHCIRLAEAKNRP